MSELTTAFQVLVIGMVTVFVILSLVVLTGRLIINIVNRFHITPNTRLPLPKKDDESEIAAIVAAVDAITEGKGRITNIKKLDT
jgi:oxaloacetate decarboxylase gamma subunit